MKLEIIGEARSGIVSGVFRCESDARGAAYCLINDGDFERDNINIVAPNDSLFAEKMEPGKDTIARTLVRTHLIFGLLGLLFGLILSALLALFGPPLTQSSPMFTTIALALIGLFLGLIFAGVVSVRPDHDPLIETTQHAIRSGCWAVVVHTLDRDEMYRAKIVMSGSAESLSETS